MKLFKKKPVKEAAETANSPSKINFFEDLKNTNLKDVGSWNSSVRMASYIAIALATTAVSSYLLVEPVTTQIDDVKQSRAGLYEKYREDKTKLVIAQQTEKQLKEIENNFIFQLSQLPTESEIPDLVEDISKTGQKSKLPLKDIRLSPEKRGEIFIEQPIQMSASGEFHSFGQFVSNISALPRIVHIQDFTATVDRKKMTVYPQVNYTITATTYRYEDVVKKAKKSKKEVKK